MIHIEKNENYHYDSVIQMSEYTLNQQQKLHF